MHSYTALKVDYSLPFINIRQNFNNGPNVNIKNLQLLTVTVPGECQKGYIFMYFLFLNSYSFRNVVRFFFSSSTMSKMAFWHSLNVLTSKPATVPPTASPLPLSFAAISDVFIKNLRMLTLIVPGACQIVGNLIIYRTSFFWQPIPAEMSLPIYFRHNNVKNDVFMYILR